METSNSSFRIPGPAGVIVRENLNRDTFSAVLIPNEGVSYSALSTFHSWQCACKFLDLQDSQEAVYSKFPCTISAIHIGMFDMKIPSLIGIVSSSKESKDGSWMITIMDYSGSIDAYIAKSSSSCLDANACEEFPALLLLGSTVIFKNDFAADINFHSKISVLKIP